MDEMEVFEWAEKPYVPSENIKEEDAPEACEIGCDSCGS
jgi:hypothetical protein